MMLKMLSGCMSAIAGMFSQREASWANADEDEINEAIRTLLEQRYGWHTKWGGGIGLRLYYRRNGELAFTQPAMFYPASSWGAAMKAAEECVEDGMRVSVPLRKGRCGSRHLCVRLLTMCKVERLVPEIVCEACGKTARRFKKDARAKGWLRLYGQSLDQKRLPFVGRCPSCGPRR